MNAGEDDYVSYTPYGFWWGNVSVTRVTHPERRGRVLHITTLPHGHAVQVYVSEGGRSVRVWKDGEEIT